jgi:inhibitor of cysteine peptidase
MKKIALFLVSLLTIVAAIAPFYFKIPEVSRQTQLKKFSSYEELKSFLQASSQVGPYYDEGSWVQTFGMTPRVLTGSGAKGEPVPDYSTTNIQVEGVDEADVIKTDGEYIYVVSENSVVILKAYPPEEAQVISQTKLNGTLRGIFINGDKLVVFEDEFGYYGSYEKFIPYGTRRTFIKVYDVSDRESPVLKRNFSLDGSYLNSRMIGDYVYAVINQPAYFNDSAVALPKFYSDDRVEEIYATEIYYSNISDHFYTFTTIVAINVQNDEQEAAHETFLLGMTHVMYVSLNNIYITIPEQTLTNGVERTTINRIHVENGEIACEANGEVPGYVLNQFSMDEYQGHFRIATTTGHVARTWTEATSRNNVYVLDTNLSIAGRLEDLAPGEKIYSARFMGDRCYLVTFRKVDPLFVIDLKNPSNPKVLGKLKITGYSDYLHLYDEDHIIGIGKETVAAEEGDFAWYKGVKISLFDVSDVEKPKEIGKYEIGDRGTDSPVLRDHKAFLFDRSRNLLVLPVLVAEIDEAKYPNGVPPYTQGDYVWQGAYVFNISLDEGLALRGRITHLENNDELMKSGYYFSSPYSVKRSIYIDNVLYTISDKKIKMNNLENLGEINEVELP